MLVAIKAGKSSCFYHEPDEHNIRICQEVDKERKKGRGAYRRVVASWDARFPGYQKKSVRALVVFYNRCKKRGLLEK